MTTATITQQIPELIHIFEVTLRSGYNLKQSLEIMVKDMDQPLAAEVQYLLDEMSAGQTLVQVLDEWPIRTQNRDIDLLVATIKVQLEFGGNLADKLQLLSQIMGKRQLATIS